MVRTDQQHTKIRVPDLEFLPPDCPVCDGELDMDPDSFRCPRCELTWDRQGTRGEVDDYSARCKAVGERTGWPEFSLLIEQKAVCFLPSEHEGHHAGYDPDDAEARNGWWSDQWRYWPREESDREEQHA